MNEELEPEVLSYREFKNRETLLAWKQRFRAHESQAGGRTEERGRGLLHVPCDLAGSEARVPPR
jgi:hypothetical protein